MVLTAKMNVHIKQKDLIELIKIRGGRNYIGLTIIDEEL